MLESTFREDYQGKLQQEKESRDKDFCQDKRKIENKKIFEEYKEGSKEGIKEGSEEAKKAKEAWIKITVIVGLETRKGVLEDLLSQEKKWPLKNFVAIYDILSNRQSHSRWKEEREMLESMKQLMINQVFESDESGEKKLSYVIRVEKRSDVLDVLIRRLLYLQYQKDTPLDINWTTVINFIYLKDLNGLPEYLLKKIEELIDIANEKGEGIEKYKRNVLKRSIFY